MAASATAVKTQIAAPAAPSAPVAGANFSHQTAAVQYDNKKCAAQIVGDAASSAR
jgi:hypothetical protein